MNRPNERVFGLAGEPFVISGNQINATNSLIAKKGASIASSVDRNLIFDRMLKMGYLNSLPI